MDRELVQIFVSGRVSVAVRGPGRKTVITGKGKSEPAHRGAKTKHHGQQVQRFRDVGTGPRQHLGRFGELAPGLA